MVVEIYKFLEQFIVVEMKKGRKPKSKKDNVETSDTEDEKKDLFKEAAQAEMEESSDDESLDDDEPLVEALKKKRKTDGTNGPAAKSPKRVRKEEEEHALKSKSKGKKGKSDGKGGKSSDGKGSGKGSKGGKKRDVIHLLCLPFAPIYPLSITFLSPPVYLPCTGRRGRR